ncbi:hypothetical protein DIS24_g11067 [Lasiodiplodia hormozganensis]|uniref:Uncharacterized protein n=1 Tax=Lasiodiplodia hormozganensis TaxID=869390 RepID=A0AA40C635_9PEZI|nr:hypothetical protein DIS24_g11067 [Lasiodiplodia hormozganensis]
MSTDSLAISRRHAGDDLADLAEQHMQHDLTAADRDTLNAAAKRFGIHTALGSLAGVALGAALFMRTRSARAKLVTALSKPATRPVEVRFQDGRVEPLPDVGQLLERTPLTDVAASLLFSIGGLFIGGELGTISGAWSARRAISRDAETKERIENAFRRFQADVLRKRAAELEEKVSKGSILESAKSVVGWK